MYRLLGVGVGGWKWRIDYKKAQGDFWDDGSSLAGCGGDYMTGCICQNL